MRGRKPKPLEAHRADGTFRADRHGEATPQPLSGVPVKPKHLKKHASECWDELTRVLPTGVLTQADFSVMALFCEAYATWRAATAKLQKFGHVLADPTTGRGFKSPWQTVANESAKQLQRLGASLGLDPASRARMRVDPPLPDSSKSRFFKYIDDVDEAAG